jgi:hypothetical protein
MTPQANEDKNTTDDWEAEKQPKAGRRRGAREPARTSKKGGRTQPAPPGEGSKVLPPPEDGAAPGGSGDLGRSLPQQAPEDPHTTSNWEADKKLL